MDETEVRHVLEAALLASRRPLPIEKLLELFVKKAPEIDRAAIRNVLEILSKDYQGRGIELKEVASGFRIQVKSTMADWLQPLWEERAPRYTRALLETLALIAYRQPVTRGEIEDVRGVTVSPNIVRTLLERGWIRVVGHRDVPGKPEMFGTTREFLDYFGLKSLDKLPALADIKDGLPEVSPQTDLVDKLESAVSNPAGAQTQHADDPNSGVGAATSSSKLSATAEVEIIDSNVVASPMRKLENAGKPHDKRLSADDRAVEVDAKRDAASNAQSPDNSQSDSR